MTRTLARSRMKKNQPRHQRELRHKSRDKPA